MPLLKHCPVCSRLSARYLAAWLAQWPRRLASRALAPLARPARWLALSASLAPSLAAESLRSCWRRLCHSEAAWRKALPAPSPAPYPSPGLRPSKPAGSSQPPYLRPGAWRAGRPGAYPPPSDSQAPPLVGLVELCRGLSPTWAPSVQAAPSSSPSAPPSASPAPSPSEAVRSYPEALPLPARWHDGQVKAWPPRLAMSGPSYGVPAGDSVPR